MRYLTVVRGRGIGYSCHDNLKLGLRLNTPDCVFCKIIHGEIPCYKIHENENYFAVLDLAQFVEGHTIAIPKAHFETVWDVQDMKGFFSFVQEIGNHFKKIGFKYVDTMTFGRMVHHCHVHIIPHNDDNPDWQRALSVIGSYQRDQSRHLSKEVGESIMKKFSF